MSPECTSASHARLDFVDHQQGSMLVAEFSGLGEESLVARNDTTFTLKRFHHDRSQTFSVRSGTFYGSLQGSNIVVLAVIKSRNHLSVVSESFVVLGLRGGGQSRQGATVERLFGSDNDGFSDATVAGMSACALNGSFVSFGSAIAEKDLLSVGIFTQPVRQGGLGRNKVQVGNVVHGFHLLCDGGIQGRVGMTQGASGNSTHTVQILLSISGGQKAPFSRLNSQGVSAICCLDILAVDIGSGLSQIFDLLGRNQFRVLNCGTKGRGWSCGCERRKGGRRRSGDSQESQ
mmetsp:Transcript_106377/g.297858  ORF Transcript_106377/g.297858 Transcript_106377/m.297858 type:complete len:289 (+) Transcript_106377:556-1422(+)